MNVVLFFPWGEKNNVIHGAGWRSVCRSFVEASALVCILCGRVEFAFIMLLQKVYQKSSHLIVTFLLKTLEGLIMEIK